MKRVGGGITIEAVDLAIAKRDWRLRFGPVLERYFRLETMASHAPTLLTCTFISCLIYPLFLLSDYRQLADVFPLMVGIRVVGFVGLSLFLMYLLWKRSDNPYIEFLCSMIAFLSVFAIIIGLSLSHSPDRPKYIPGFVIGMIYGTVVHRPRFGYSLGLVASIIAVAVVYLELSGIVDKAEITRHTLFFVASGILMLMASYTFERATRLAFLHGLRGRLLNEQLKKVAMTDPLTGLGNRRYFEAAVERIWADPESCRSVALVMIDLDYFKRFNDAHGHIAGDECLVRVARAIEGALRSDSDILARFGGEELVVLLPNSDQGTARLMAETIRLAISSLAIPHRGVGTDAIVTASLGVAAGAVGAISMRDLLDAADRALYEAKTAGKDCVRVAQETSVLPTPAHRPVEQLMVG